ncbi:tRNA threonylcarbamoyladenosine biosynthesis protein TsaB [Candidatus Providencia siddallii]|uniref:tRNA threonylcarbamoyladenosine biosynthesis protein TsaB n=1 Tax=Candidatus Providencia siddallii TaxID=1715285 RepID=A0A0M6W9R6_9GAMM|nr:tRNA threonylcarbamoyladenosine biosynthesis protein TsaB [Candidatus Providencia siddallii]
MSKRFLSIDTSTDACSVALIDNNRIISRFAISFRKHEQKILPMVEEVLSQVKITLSQLDALIFNKGPGSFTGVRVGIGVSQGLALGANLPLIGVSSLMTLAEGAYRVTGQSKILTIINASASKVYYAQYERDKNGIWLGEETEVLLTEECVKIKLISLSGLWSYAGNCWLTYQKFFKNNPFIKNSKIILSNAQDMLPIANNLWSQGKIIKIENAKATYLCNII